ncbi:hypothetical protein GNT69_08085 [Bacillus sp. B15-48]|nr:hypothetical protein [Bacillus sp. B15-48]
MTTTLKRFIALLLIGVLTIGIFSGCNSKNEEHVLDDKHAMMPDYVLQASPKVQETYILAAKYPEVLASVPCYCNCYESSGHMNNLACFVKDIGPDKAVNQWDPHGIT